MQDSEARAELCESARCERSMVRWPPTDGQPNANDVATPRALGNFTKSWRSLMCLRAGLTFDMSGGWRRAQPAGNRPLDGRVRPLGRNGSHWPTHESRETLGKISLISDQAATANTTQHMERRVLSASRSRYGSSSDLYAPDHR